MGSDLFWSLEAVALPAWSSFVDPTQNFNSQGLHKDSNGFLSMLVRGSSKNVHSML